MGLMIAVGIVGVGLPLLADAYRGVNTIVALYSTSVAHDNNVNWDDDFELSWESRNISIPGGGVPASCRHILASVIGLDDLCTCDDDSLNRPDASVRYAVQCLGRSPAFAASSAAESSAAPR